MNDPDNDSVTYESPETSDLTDHSDRSSARIKRHPFRWIRMRQIRLMDLIWLVALAAILIRSHFDHQEIVELRTLINGQRSRGNSWSTIQLLGKPNSPRAADQSSAWASMHQNNANEWVMVEFPRRVKVTRIDVYENYNPGAVNRISRYRD